MPNRRRAKKSGRPRNHRNPNHHKSQGSATPSLLPSTPNLPHDAIVNILSRLPVKSLLRFRSVSKRWRTLLRSPRFIQAHFHSSSQNPDSHSLLLRHVHDKTCHHHLTLFPLTSPHNPVNLENPFPFYYLDMDVVASCNGIVCLAKPPWADGIRIWNPATRQSKRVYLPHPRLDPSVFDNVSLGLGFDPAVNDFKLISILLYKRNVAGQPRTEVYVYSLDTGKWRAIKAEPPFTYLSTKCEAVVKGVPYWVTQIDDEFGVRLAFVWFDFENELFHTLPFPAIPWEEMKIPCFADLNGSLAVVVSSLVPFVDVAVDVYLMEDVGGGIESWVKKYSVGPIEGMARLRGCLTGGMMVAEDVEGNAFLYDPETGRVEHLEVGQVKRNSLAVFNYTESMVVIKDAKSQPFEPLEEKMLETMNRHGLHVKLLQGRDGEIQYGYVDDGRINIVDLNLLFSSDDDEP